MSLMTVASALAQLLQSADCSQDAEERLIEETDGFILSRDVTSSIDVPPFSNSAMDGYAVRAEDVAVGRKTSRRSGHCRRRYGGTASSRKRE